MEDVKFCVCFILENKYKEIFDLPINWDKLDTNLKCELLGKALDEEKQIEELQEYKELKI